MRRPEIKSPPPATTSGVLKKLCLFCCQISKKKNKRYTLINYENIKKSAMWREDNQFLVKIQDIYFSSKEIFTIAYHITEEGKNKKEVLFVANLNTFYEELVNYL